ncbi:uncharacterized protein LOC122255272 [Penaeus japonicus]|uniref:uncharacterized protein LOC122255272 n=1 Tax=Penaeus japonicus TaxID=27405 RepID=UPI001C7163D6|nr:uncharacterized protein LOC122255272 [Penaeus japonicus]
MKNQPLKEMSGPAMRIYVSPDAKPYKVHNARVLPLAIQDKTKNELDSMESRGIIEQVGEEITEWCAPMVPVMKTNGDIRITTDFKHLNKYVERPSHPSSSPYSKLRQIKPGAKYYATMDALQGYWQLKVDPESKKLPMFHNTIWKI